MLPVCGGEVRDHTVNDIMPQNTILAARDAK